MQKIGRIVFVGLSRGARTNVLFGQVSRARCFAAARAGRYGRPMAEVATGNGGDDTRTCAIEIVRPLVSALDAMGADVAAVLSRAGLREDQISDVELRVPETTIIAAWDAARAVTGDPALGLHVVEHLQAGAVSTFANLFTYLAATSATPRDASARALRYMPLVHDGAHFTMEPAGDRILCKMEVARPSTSRITSGEYLVGLMAKIAPEVVGDVGDTWAMFKHAEPAYGAEYERILGMRCRFEQSFYGLSSPAGGLDVPLPKADSALCTVLSRYAEGLLEKLPREDAFPALVRRRVSEALPTGDTSAEAVAEGAGVSVRTMRRRLKEARTSHQQILDEVRRELACQTLRTPGLSVHEAAFLVGFSDASAFHKAFRRWTGRSPSDYAREAAHE